MFHVKKDTRFLFHGNNHKFCIRNLTFQSHKPFLIHANIIIRYAKHSAMPPVFQITSSLYPAIKVIDLNIYKVSRTFHISVIDHKRDMHLFPQFFIILFAVTD